MKKLILLMPFLFLLVGSIQAQEVKKTETKKVVIIKKKTDENGKVIHKRIEATGSDADKLLKEMKESGELEDVDIEITTDEKIKIEKKHSTSNISVTKDDDGEKRIEVTVEKEGNGDGVVVMKINEGKMDETKVMKWVLEGGEFPQDLKELMEKENIDIQFGDEDGEKMHNIFIEIDDEDLPEVKVRMGVKVMGKGNVSIAEVEEGSAAEKAGLQKGDIITEIDDYQIKDYRSLMERLADYEAGNKIKIRYIRDGKANTASLKLLGRD